MAVSQNQHLDLWDSPHVVASRHRKSSRRWEIKQQSQWLVCTLHRQGNRRYVKMSILSEPPTALKILVWFLFSSRFESCISSPFIQLSTHLPRAPGVSQEDEQWSRRRNQRGFGLLHLPHFSRTSWGQLRWFDDWPRGCVCVAFVKMRWFKRNGKGNAQDSRFWDSGEVYDYEFWWVKPLCKNILDLQVHVW